MYLFRLCLNLVVGMTIAATKQWVAGWGFYQFCLLILVLIVWAFLALGAFDDQNKIDQAQDFLKVKRIDNIFGYLQFGMAIYFAAQGYLLIASVMTLGNALFATYRLFIIAVVQAMATEETTEETNANKN